MTPKEKAARRSGPELFRILLMVGIVAHHFVVHGADYSYLKTESFSAAFISSLRMAGKVGVDGYVLVSGFFLITSAFAIHRILKVWLPMFVIAIGIATAFALSGVELTKNAPWLSAFFPATRGLWWFASAYLLLYLISPLLNRLAMVLSGRGYAVMLVALTGVFVILPAFIDQTAIAPNVVWFSYLYLLAGFVRLHGMALAQRLRWVALIGGMVAYFTPVAIAAFRTRLPDARWAEIAQSHLFSQDHLCTVAAAFGFFIFFITSKMGSYALINVVAGATFGVYLIHDHPMVRNLLWQQWLVPPAGASGLQLAGFAIGAVLAVFAAAAVIELARRRIVDIPVFAAIDRRVSRRDATAVRPDAEAEPESEPPVRTAEDNPKDSLAV